MEMEERIIGQIEKVVEFLRRVQNGLMEDVFILKRAIDVAREKQEFEATDSGKSKKARDLEPITEKQLMLLKALDIRLASEEEMTRRRGDELIERALENTK